MKYNKLLMGLTLLGCVPETTVFAEKNETASPETKQVGAKHTYLHWLQHAEIDLKAAKKLSESHELAGPVVYHIQQCVEKALKAYLVYNHKPVAKTHNLTELLNLCSRVDNEFMSVQEAASELTPYATISRYPNNRFSLPDSAAIEKVIGQALHILRLVKNKMEF